MALAGHSGMQTAQSMHSSGSMTSMFGPSRKQSTGHTSTQSVYLHLMQFSETTWVMTGAVWMAWVWRNPLDFKSVHRLGAGPTRRPRHEKVIALPEPPVVLQPDGRSAIGNSLRKAGLRPIGERNDHQGHRLVSRHGSDVVGCAQPSERSARRIARPIPSCIGKRCNAAMRFDGQRRPTDDR